MHAKLRYSAVLAFLLLACLIYLVAKHASAPQHRKERRSSYLGRSHGGQPGPPGILSGRWNNVLLAPPPPRPLNSTLCTMASCFDFSLCHGRPFRLYVYPFEEAVNQITTFQSGKYWFWCNILVCQYTNVQIYSVVVVVFTQPHVLCTCWCW